MILVTRDRHRPSVNQPCGAVDATYTCTIPALKGCIPLPCRSEAKENRSSWQERERWKVAMLRTLVQSTSDTSTWCLPWPCSPVWTMHSTHMLCHVQTIACAASGCACLGLRRHTPSDVAYVECKAMHCSAFLHACMPTLHTAHTQPGFK